LHDPAGSRTIETRSAPGIDTTEPRLLSRQALNKEGELHRKRLGLLVLGLLIVGIAAFVSAVSQPADAFFNCKIVSCACPACNDNEHLETPPGECCPQCVPN
jgi:hypothetical protein